MVEVKSSTSVKDYHLTDAAIQSWVAQQANLPLTSVEIAHIDNSFVYPGGGDYQGLFHYTDISEQITGMKAEVPIWMVLHQMHCEISRNVREFRFSNTPMPS